MPKGLVEEDLIQSQTHIIDVQKFLWVPSILQNKHPSEQQENTVQKKELKVEKKTLYLFLKWIKIEISQAQDKLNKTSSTQLEKIILSISNEGLAYVAALTTELRKIMRNHSCKPELKKELLENEIFKDNNPYWPSRWFVYVDFKVIEEDVIPQMLWQLQQVEFLKFSKQNIFLGNSICNLPHDIGLLRDLKYLDLKDNELESLPNSLQFCKKLEELRLERNNFRTLPSFLITMPNLKTLSRQGNSFYHSFHINRDAVIENPDEDKIEGPVTTDENFNCGSLRSITINWISKQQTIIVQDMMDKVEIPKHIKSSLFDHIQDYLQCDNCYDRGLTIEKAYKCNIHLDVFCGCTNIPIIGYTCSLTCAGQLCEELNKRNKPFSDLTTVYTNKDYKHSCRRGHGRGRGHGILSRIFRIFHRKSRR